MQREREKDIEKSRYSERQVILINDINGER